MLLESPARQPISDIEFTILLGDMLKDLRRYARRLCRREDAAEDLVQDTLRNAWASRGRFMPGTSFRRWAFRLLRSLFMRSPHAALRRVGRRRAAFA